MHGRTITITWAFSNVELQFTDGLKIKCFMACMGDVCMYVLRMIIDRERRGRGIWWWWWWWWWSWDRIGKVIRRMSAMYVYICMYVCMYICERKVLEKLGFEPNTSYRISLYVLMNTLPWKSRFEPKSWSWRGQPNGKRRTYSGRIQSIQLQRKKDTMPRLLDPQETLIPILPGIFLRFFRNARA